MTKYFRIRTFGFLILAIAAFSAVSFGQVTTAEMAGRITNEQGEPLPGVSIEAEHTPTGTRYTAVTNESGRFTLPLIRVGGPYTIKANYPGFKEQTQQIEQIS